MDYDAIMRELLSIDKVIKGAFQQESLQTDARARRKELLRKLPLALHNKRWRNVWPDERGVMDYQHEQGQSGWWHRWNALKRWLERKEKQEREQKRARVSE